MSRVSHPLYCIYTTFSSTSLRNRVSLTICSHATIGNETARIRIVIQFCSDLPHAFRTFLGSVWGYYARTDQSPFLSWLPKRNLRVSVLLFLTFLSISKLYPAAFFLNYPISFRYYASTTLSSYSIKCLPSFTQIQAQNAVLRPVRSFLQHLQWLRSAHSKQRCPPIPISKPAIRMRCLRSMLCD
jgi:hypothetical protein